MGFAITDIKGVIPAMITTFDKDEKVDLGRAEKLTEFLIGEGVNGLYITGSTGEGFLLTDDERKRLVEAVTDEVGGEMNIIVHVGCASTRQSVELARHAEQAGADATSAVPCVYYRPSEEGVYRHWTAITEAADLPFFIYNIPQLTGFNL